MDNVCHLSVYELKICELHSTRTNKTVVCGQLNKNKLVNIVNLLIN